MTLPSASNAISMSDIRTEFGGSGQLSLSDLYQASGTGATNMLVRNVDSNDAIPDSGEISFGDFHGITGNSATGYELISLFTEDSSRQYSFSRWTLALGMSSTSGTTQTESYNSSYNTTGSSSDTTHTVSGSNTFSSTLPNGIWGATSGSTHIMLNYSQVSPDPSYPVLTVGGSGVTETNDSTINLIHSYYTSGVANTGAKFNSFKSNSDIGGLSIGVTYTKKSTTFHPPLQMYFGIPGKWSKAAGTSGDSLYNFSSGTSTTYTAAKGDLIFMLSAQWYGSANTQVGSYDNSTLLFLTQLYRTSNICLRILRADAAGTTTFSVPDGYKWVAYIAYRMD